MPSITIIEAAFFLNVSKQTNLWSQVFHTLQLVLRIRLGSDVKTLAVTVKAAIHVTIFLEIVQEAVRQAGKDHDVFNQVL